MQLYKISQEIQDVLDLGTDTETGELSDDVIQRLDELTGDLEHKALSVACVVKGDRAEATAIKAEMKELGARAKRLERHAGGLLDYLFSHIEPGSSFSDARVSINWRKSTAVEVLDEKLVDLIYKRLVPAKHEIDKQSLTKALKDGIEVKGARLDHRMNLQIK